MLSLSIPEQKSTTNLAILPDTEFLSDQMPRVGVSLDNSPFIVGRKATVVDKRDLIRANLTLGDLTGDSNNDSNMSGNLPQIHLGLTDNKPYCLSRIHFLIQLRPNGRYIVRDLCSTIGTFVNDSLLGKKSQNYFADLEDGTNTIRIGSGDTMFRFRVTIDPL
jgi:pSer/pThr/pTyr-binding forkhead associated (FHA) protein